MRAPVLAIGDGALGFWGALREAFPDTREQRHWFHKIGNVLAALPKSAHPGAKKALAEIWNAEDSRHVLDTVRAFEAAYGAKFPKAVAKITDDVDELLAVAFKLIESAQARWPAVNAPELVALVRARARFEGGKLVERPDDHAPPTVA